MKRLFLLILTVCLLLSSSAVWGGPKKGGKSDDFVFRRVKWGMTMEQVKASENRPDGMTFVAELPPDSFKCGACGPQLLYQTDKILDSPKTEVYYEFNQGKLRSIALNIYFPIMGISDRRLGFEKVRNALAIKYGAPYLRDDNSLAWTLPTKRLGTWFFTYGPGKADSDCAVVAYDLPGPLNAYWGDPSYYKKYLDDL